MKITFLGGGNMATALVSGLRAKGYSAAGMQVIEPLEENREKLTASFGIRCAEKVDASALNCDVIVLAVKPQQMKAAVAPLVGKLKRHLVISIAAGLRVADLGRWLGGHALIVRGMPNTPAMIGAGLTGLYAAPAVNEEGRAVAEQILQAVGATLWVNDEAQIDAVTAISGSGPAYVFHFIESLQDAAVALGFNIVDARRLAVETFLGAAKLAAQSPDPVALLRERVTSKGGTTAAALDSFYADNIHDAIERGTRAACARGRELGEILGQD